MSGHHKCACGCRESDHATDFDCCTPGCPCKGFVRGAAEAWEYDGSCSACNSSMEWRGHREPSTPEEALCHDCAYEALDNTIATLRSDLAQASSLLREAEARLVGAVAAERERCAKVAMAWADKQGEVARAKSTSAPVSAQSHQEMAWTGLCIGNAILRGGPYGK